MDVSSSSSLYSGTSLIEASQNYHCVHQHQQSPIPPPSPASSSSHRCTQGSQQHHPRSSISSSQFISSYGGESLLEASKGHNGNETSNPGLTSPEDVHLSDSPPGTFDLEGRKPLDDYYEDCHHDPSSRQLTSGDEEPVLLNVRQSTRDRRTQPPESSSSEDDTDVYQPPERATVDNRSAGPVTEHQPPLHIIGESFFKNLEYNYQ